MGEVADATQILVDLGNGDRSAAKRLMPLVYDQLRGLAQRYMQQERAGHTFQATAVVHEAYIRLIDQTSIDWKSRAHFFAVAAEIMRHVLVDYARQHVAAKRGGGAKRVMLTAALEPSADRELDLLDLDEALAELGTLNERQKQIVEMRFFGGLTANETAHVLGVTRETVTVDWRMARAWLRQRLDR